METTNPGSNAISILLFHGLLNENKWLTIFLEKYDVRVELASDGQDLFDKAMKIRPDVVIMDVQMDGISGLDCLRMIRNENPHIRTILISNIGSHSIGQSAIELEVDLYCDQSRRAVNVVSFLKKMMGLGKFKPSSSKKPKPTRTLSGADLSQRMKDRYPVSGAITMVFEGNEYQGVFENLSLGGAKIRVTQIPPLPSPIELKWAFKGGVSFHVNAVTVRQNMVFEPSDEFVWVVGVKFVKLTAQQIKDLADLVSQISKFYEKKFDFVDFEQIRKMLVRQEKYFKPILQGQKAPLLVEKAMKEIKEYERESFTAETEMQTSIAKLLSFRIVCRVLRQSLNWVEIHPEEGLKLCVPLIFDVLSKVDGSEGDFDELIREAADLEIKKQLVESSNLILEQKDKLIQAFHNHCHSMVPEDEYKEQFDSIIKRYEDLQSYQHFLEVEVQAKEEEIVKKTLQQQPMYKVSKQTQKEKEKTIIAKKKKLELQKIRENIIPTIAFGIVLSTILYYGLNIYDSFVKPADTKLSLAASKVKIKKLYSLEVQTDSRTWDALEPERKVKVMDELEVFLTSRSLFQAKIMDGDKLIAVVYSTHNMDKLRYGYDIFE